jgi:hypothetical protein
MIHPSFHFELECDHHENSMSQLLGPALVKGDHAKMSTGIGWQPELPMDATLLNFYRY